VSFLIRTAVLDRMCGPLCDAVLATTGSAELLESLAGSHLLLVPLDRRREWYCYHHLFRDLLRAELERREPELVPKLHQRAAVWCEANGLEETAIDHAKAAGDADQIARLVLQVMQPVWASGRGDLNQALLQLAHAYIALGDPDGAHAVLRQADDILQQRLNLGMLPAQAKELRTRVTTMKQTGLGASAPRRRPPPSCACCRCSRPT
jgi:ATP/maltotriose-dependent transcriptional regulator MalT